MSTENSRTSDIDLFSDDVLLDPYPTYEALRETAGVVHLPANDVYALTRYDVIRDALADTETFSSSSIGFNPMVNEALQGTSLASDPPVHTQLRATLSANLTPRALRGLKGADRGEGRHPRRRARRAGLVRGHRPARPGLPDPGRRRPDRLPGRRPRQHAALGPGRDGGHRPPQPADRRELPDRRRALRLVLAGQRRGPRARLGRPRHLRRRGARRDPRRARRATSSTSTSVPGWTHGRRDRQHHRPVRGPPRPARPGPQGPRARRIGVQRGAPLLGARPRLGTPRDP